MVKTPKSLKFEEAMSKLVEMIQKLEEGRLPLDDSLQVFEEGMHLVDFCEQKLGEAEAKVETLTKSTNPPSNS